MNSIEKMTAWGDRHHSGWFDIVRVILGVFLFYKGLEFGAHPHEITQLINLGGLSLLSLVLIHYIPMVHLTGGLMIAVGFKTRWAVAFQLPILLGAILLSAFAGPMALYSVLGISILVFAALIGFMIYGSGPYSLDAYFNKEDGFHDMQRL